jgi:hypothetical protein
MKFLNFFFFFFEGNFCPPESGSATLPETCDIQFLFSKYFCNQFFEVSTSTYYKDKGSAALPLIPCLTALIVRKLDIIICFFIFLFLFVSDARLRGSPVTAQSGRDSLPLLRRRRHAGHQKGHRGPQKGERVLLANDKERVDRKEGGPATGQPAPHLHQH